MLASWSRSFISNHCLSGDPDVRGQQNLSPWQAANLQLNTHAGIKAKSLTNFEVKIPLQTPTRGKFDKIFIIRIKNHTTSDLHQRIAELTSIKNNRRPDRKFLIWYDIFLRFAHSLRANYLWERRYSWLEMTNGHILNNSFIWEYRSVAKKLKWAKPTASRWTRLNLKEQNSSIITINFAHTNKEHVNDSIPQWQHARSFDVNRFVLCCNSNHRVCKLQSQWYHRKSLIYFSTN